MRGIEQIPWLYDAMCALMEWGGLDRWRAWLAGGAKGRTLEVGAGTGRNLPLYRTQTFAVEPSSDALQKARSRAAGATLIRASAEALPFKAGAFDTVVSSLVFCSVDRPAIGLSEIKRVLKPEGELRMIEHVRPAGKWGAKWADFIQPAWTRLAGGCRPNRDTERAVEAAGFAIDKASLRARDTMRRFTAKKASS